MQVITSDFVLDKKVLLRYDIDVDIKNGEVIDDFRLKAGLPTLQLCLDNSTQVTLVGHIGRPVGEPTSDLSIAAILKWFEENGFKQDLIDGKLHILENLRFDPREDQADKEFAQELAEMGDVYINESFAAYHEAASTTVLPTLLPHFAGLHFAKEVEMLTRVRQNPQKPLVVIMGGAKVEDKLPVIEAMARIADYVLVGGKLVQELSAISYQLSDNVLVGKLKEDGFDITSETTENWAQVIKQAKTIIWNGPLGKFEDPKNDQTKRVAELIIESQAESIVGGGETLSAIDSWGLKDKFTFVSTGGGAMLKFLAEGTLPTIDALQ